MPTVIPAKPAKRARAGTHAATIEGVSDGIPDSRFAASGTAASSSRQPVFPRRGAEFGPEAAREVRQVVETDIQRDIGHGRVRIGKPLGSLPQSRTQQPLMRGDAGHGAE